MTTGSNKWLVQGLLQLENIGCSWGNVGTACFYRREGTHRLALFETADPQPHTWDSTLHAVDFSLPTVSEPSCLYQHTTTGRKYAVKLAISEFCKHSGCAEGKQRRFRFFQTANNAKIVWESETKPKGILGGDLIIISIIFSKKSKDQRDLLNSAMVFTIRTERVTKTYNLMTGLYEPNMVLIVEH